MTLWTNGSRKNQNKLYEIRTCRDSKNCVIITHENNKNNEIIVKSITPDVIM